MSSSYFLIPTTELIPGMVVHSTSRNTSELQTRTYSSVDYYIVEVEDSVLASTEIFNAYTRYRASELDDADPYIVAQKIDFTGIIAATATASQTTTANYVYNENRIITATQFIAFNANAGDYINLYTYIDATDTLVGQFVTNFYVSSTPFYLSVPSALVASGLRHTIEYVNVGPNDVKFYLNAFLWRE